MKFLYLLVGTILPSFLVNIHEARSLQSNGSKPFSSESRLVHTLLDNYNKHLIFNLTCLGVVQLMYCNVQVRPHNPREKTKVRMGMTLVQIIEVNSKSEYLLTSVYMGYAWRDDRLKWDPATYEGITLTRVPIDSIWMPNIILENSVEQRMTESLRVNALVWFDGSIEWLPPSLFKSSCTISVSLYPFDWQNCSLTFRSVDYDQSQLTFGLTYGDQIVVDENAFQPNGEWDLLQVPIAISRSSSDAKFEKVHFTVIIKRRPQFYVMSILLPCVLLSVLSCFTFYLPVVAGEKISLSISLLLGYTVFIFLFAQLMPSTAYSLPILAAYILFTMGLLTYSIICCVFVYHLHYRTDLTHKMPARLRHIFFNIIGPSIGMCQPNHKWSVTSSGFAEPSVTQKPLKKTRQLTNLSGTQHLNERLFESQANRLGFRSRQMAEEGDRTDLNATPTVFHTASPDFRPTVSFLKYITGKMRNKRQLDIASEDWCYFALILDRLFLRIYLIGIIVGTIGFYLCIALTEYPEMNR